MTASGDSFSVPYEQLIASLEDSIRYGVEQPDRVSFEFRVGMLAYELPSGTSSVGQVTGMVKGRFTPFVRNQDYQVSGNRLVWREAQQGPASPDPPQRPDPGSRFEVELAYREPPSGLTDFNPGSVVGTLVRAVARELKLLYEQMDQAYRRAFIDEATGVALDNVVALLGVPRNPATSATGFVTFLRKGAGDRVSVDVNTKLADASGREFETTAAVAIEAQLDERPELSGMTVRVGERIAELLGVWPPQVAPEPATRLKVKAGPYGTDERTITLADDEPARSGQLLVRYRPRSVRAPVRAVQPGPGGNVNAGTVVLMPTPPPGIDEVVNEAPIDGGQDAEPDDQLRERAKHELERGGKATLDAIRFEVLDVDGVQGVEVSDHGVDDQVPLGRVVVRYSTSGGGAERLAEIRQLVVDATNRARAAGVIAEVETITSVLVSGTWFVIPSGPASGPALAAFRAAAVAALADLGIGEPLSVRRLSALVYRVDGLADVAEAQLEWQADPSDPTEPVPDPLVVERTQQVRPDEANLRVVALTALRAQTVQTAADRHQIDLRLLAGDAPVAFRDLAMDLRVTVRARLKRTPDQPPERIASITRQIRWVGSETGKLELDDQELRSPPDGPGYRPDDHDPELEVTIAAAAYAAIAEATTTITMTS